MALFSRRKFLSDTGKAAALSGILPLGVAAFPGGRSRPVAPSDQVNVALIGGKGIGKPNLDAFLKVPGVNCAAICDVDQSVLGLRLAETEAATGKRPKAYADFRKLLEQKDIEAVIVSTPDHWHALQTIYACQAGKDVYVEKPLANSIEECQAIGTAVARYGRVVQVGMQQRSGPHWQEAVGFVRSGQLGRIRAAKAWSYAHWKGAVPKIADEPVPEGVDYDLWLGPAPKKPFNRNRFHFTFRWYWDYAGGLMTDWGVHLIDIVLFGMDVGGPRSVTASGGKFAFPKDDMETPDTMKAIYEFDGFVLDWEHTIGIGLGPYGKSHGVAFIGENGTLVADRSGWEVLPEAGGQGGQGYSVFRMPALPKQPARGDDRFAHALDFVNCVKSRENPVCPVAQGANTANVAHLGNISYRLGRKINWDSKTSTIVGDPEATEMGLARYRAPWTLPKS